MGEILNKGLIAVIGSAVTALVFLGIRMVSNSFVFPGIHIKSKDFADITDRQNIQLDDLHRVNRKSIAVGDLKGCSYKCSNPESNLLSDKCIIICGPNAAQAADIASIHAMKTFLNKGATVFAIDYRGFGYSKLPAATLRISQNTLYKDGEAVYKYVSENLGYNSKNIIVFGFSLGGSVASHIAAYASSKGQALGGLIFASPINGLYNVAKDLTCKPLAALARTTTMSALDTENNLKHVKYKDIPIFICSGDKKCDFLSLESTLLNQKIKKLGFTNVTTHIESNCSHNELNKMFEHSKAFHKSESSFYDYVNSLCSRSCMKNKKNI